VVEDVAVVAQVAEAVEVQPTVISVNLEVVAVDQDMAVVVVVDLAVPQLQAMAVALVDLLLLQLPMVVLQLTVAALVAEATVIHLEVEAANLGGNFTLHGAALFLFDSTSVHLRRNKGVNGYPSRMQKLFHSRYLLLRFRLFRFSGGGRIPTKLAPVLCKWGRLNSRFSTIERHKNR